MQTRRLFCAISFTGMMALAGCGQGIWETSYADTIDPAVSKNWRVSQVEVTVPKTLSVSEANAYAPSADIVWRGEPIGDRYAQVDAIITDAAKEGASRLKGRQPVRLEIVVSNFHAITEKTRYTLENTGIHNISFTAQVFDVRTGDALTPADPIIADLIAYSGTDALLAESRGETQRVRIVAHVANVVSGWLGAGPDVRRTFKRSGR